MQVRRFCGQFARHAQQRQHTKVTDLARAALQDLHKCLLLVLRMHFHLGNLKQQASFEGMQLGILAHSQCSVEAEQLSARLGAGLVATEQLSCLAVSVLDGTPKLRPQL